MKPWLLVVIIPALTVAVYLVLNPGQMTPTIHAAVQIAPNHPFFHPGPVTVPIGTTGMEYGKKAFAEGRPDDAVAAFGSVYASTSVSSEKMAAMELAAQALIQKNDPASRAYAKELLEKAVQDFKEGADLDSAYYNLGLIAVQEADVPQALFDFTTLIQEYPASPLAGNAAAVSRQLASVMIDQHLSLKARIGRYVDPFLPRNSAALIGVLTSILTTMIWFAHDWKKHYDGLIVRKDPVLWLIVVSIVALAGVNYFMEDQAHARSMLDAARAIPVIVGR